MRVEGRLAAATVQSPTHAINVKGGQGALEITLAGHRDTLDRDLVLQFALAESLPPAAVTVQDGERWVALATVPLPEAGDHEDQAPRCIPILVDCSGSMQGDSIAQARKALGRILESLRPQDHFNIIRFGSHIEPLFPSPRAASKEALDSARALLANLDADLGGTEIGQALTAAFAARPNDFAVQDLMLITDGEVWNGPEFVERARASGDRVFTVGVGSAVSEAFLRELAEKTDGACELVTPREDIKARIERHFRRIYQKRLEAPRIEWPSQPERQSPASLAGIYLGDTLHLFAWFNERPEGMVRFLETSDTSDTIRLETELSAPSDHQTADSLPRLAARAGLAELPERERAQEAERYQLLTDQTAWIILAQRDDKERSDTLPALCKVPHMLAAGWGGMGSVKMCVPCMDIKADYENHSIEREYSDDAIDIAAHLKKGRYSKFDTTKLAERFSQHFHPGWFRRVPAPSFRDLEILGVPEDCVDALREILDGDLDESDVVAFFLAELLHAHRDSMPRRGAQRILRVYEKWGHRLPEEALDRVRLVAKQCAS